MANPTPSNILDEFLDGQRKFTAQMRRAGRKAYKRNQEEKARVQKEGGDPVSDAAGLQELLNRGSAPGNGSDANNRPTPGNRPAWTATSRTAPSLNANTSPSPQPSSAPSLTR